MNAEAYNGVFEMGEEKIQSYQLAPPCTISQYSYITQTPAACVAGNLHLCLVVWTHKGLQGNTNSVLELFVPSIFLGSRA